MRIELISLLEESANKWEFKAKLSSISTSAQDFKQNAEKCRDIANLLRT